MELGDLWAFTLPSTFYLQNSVFCEPTSGLEPLTCSLRVIGQALQGFAGGCKSRIFGRLSLLRLAACCTVLRSRWYQSGINSPPCALTLLCKASGCSAVCGTSLDGPHSCHKRQMALTIKRFRTQAFGTYGGTHPIPLRGDAPGWSQAL